MIMSRVHVHVIQKLKSVPVGSKSKAKLVAPFEQSDEDSDDDETTAVKKHKKTLDKLKNTDPEFYQFLSENDRELLEFGSSDSEDDERGGQIHELPNPEELEVGSDESDFEDQESSAKRQGNVITQSMVDKWQQELQDPK